MDRQIIYPGQIPLDTDQLSQARNALVAGGRAYGQIFGAGTVSVGGFECSAGAGLQVIVAPGVLVSPGTVDDIAYGSLPADESPLPRQYIMADPVAIAIGTGKYTVYATGSRIDQGSIDLPYYNAENPSQTLAGPNNTGSAQATVRSDVAAVSILPVGNTPPAGAVAVATIEVPAGSTSVTAQMISAVAPSAAGPVYPTIPQLTQGRLLNAYPVLAAAAVQPYVPTPGTRLVILRAVAAGGSGGSVPACGAGVGAAGGGGSAGASIEVVLQASSLAGATFTVPYGAPAPNAGQIGGNTASDLVVSGASGTIFSLAGGAGGGYGSAYAESLGGGAPGRGNQVTLAVGETLSWSNGGCGSPGIALGGATNFFGQGGTGGQSMFGAGGQCSGQNSPGGQGNYGGGGAGACAAPNGGEQPGGAGGDAHIVVYEYA